jgi:hypothetical protein
MFLVGGVLAILATLSTSVFLGWSVRMPKFLMPLPHGYRDLLLPPAGVIGLLAFMCALYSHSGWLAFSGLMLAAVFLGLWYGIRKALGY